MPLSEKGKLAVAALRVVVLKESRELEAAMVGIEEEMEGRLSLMFGPQHPKWSQMHLYDFPLAAGLGRSEDPQGACAGDRRELQEAGQRHEPVGTGREAVPESDGPGAEA